METQEKVPWKKILKSIALYGVFVAMIAVTVFVKPRTTVNAFVGVLGLFLLVLGVLEVIKGFRNAKRALKEKTSRQLLGFWVEALAVTFFGAALTIFSGFTLLN